MKSKTLQYKWLYETYEKDLFSYGMAFGVERELLEDAIQDVFLFLYEHPHHLEGSGNVKFYLLNCLKNRLRSLKRREVNTENLDDTNEYSFLIKVDGFEVIEEEEERIAIARQVEEMLQSLTDRQREAIYLRYMHGLGFDEIAELMGIKTKAAQKLVYRAIDYMRENYPPAVFFFFFNHFF